MPDDESKGAPAPLPMAGARPSARRILVVEDSPMNQQVLRAMLKRLGQTPVMVESGEEAVAAVLRETFDLVLMDIHMAGMSGLDAAREICRQIPAERRPRLVAMTGSASDADDEVYVKAGMDGCLPKPMHLADLMNLLASCTPRS